MPVGGPPVRTMPTTEPFGRIVAAKLVSMLVKAACAPAKSRSQCRREKRNGAPKPKPPPGAKTLEQVEQERRAKVAAKEQKQPANGGWGNSNGGKAAGLIDARTLYNARTPD